MKFVIKVILISALLLNAAVAGQEKKTSGEQLQQLAEQALTQQLTSHAVTHIQLKARNSSAGTEWPLTTIQAEVTDVYPPHRYTCVHLHTPNKTLQLWFRVVAQQKVWVSSTHLKGHQYLDKQQLRQELRNIAGYKETPVTTLPAHAWLAQSINKGQIITRNHLAKKPDILRGEQVTVLVKQAPIAITTQAIAQHDAAYGQPIRLKLANQKMIHAVVTGQQCAEVRT